MEEKTSIPCTDLGNEEIQFVLVRTTWTNPGQEATLHFQIIAVERTTGLAELQQAIQDDFEEHAEEDHPGATMTVEVWDAAHVPEGMIPEGAEVTSSEEVAELAKAIARAHHS
ncbi:MAG: hypothetical protein JO183_07050 [Ktedonobacteraceae bacterium]|nr:hypothetical protein [Ktedonobacteraceae bacterium]